MIIAVDFDNTIAVNAYPDIGSEIPGAIDTLLECQKLGARLILYTMRDGDTLKEAITWCSARGLVFWDHNLNPEQHTWSKSPKVYADLFIDDRGFGMPKFTMEGQSVVDWIYVTSELIQTVKAVCGK